MPKTTFGLIEHQTPRDSYSWLLRPRSGFGAQSIEIITMSHILAIVFFPCTTGLHRTSLLPYQTTQIGVLHQSRLDQWVARHIQRIRRCIQSPGCYKACNLIQPRNGLVEFYRILKANDHTRVGTKLLIQVCDLTGYTVTYQLLYQTIICGGVPKLTTSSRMVEYVRSI
jgi:hypothetical protein